MLILCKLWHDSCILYYTRSVNLNWYCWAVQLIYFELCGCGICGLIKSSICFLCILILNILLLVCAKPLFFYKVFSVHLYRYHCQLHFVKQFLKMTKNYLLILSSILYCTWTYCRLFTIWIKLVCYVTYSTGNW